MKYFLALLCVLASAAYADVYRSVNEAGEVVFTDVPTEGSVRVELPPLSTVKPPEKSQASLLVKQRIPEEKGPAYLRFEVATPEQDASIWDNQGNIKLGVLLEPALQTRSGHRIQFFLDDQPYGVAEQSLVTHFKGLDRGTHTLGAAVVDAEGAPLISADPVTIHLHKASVQHPNNPLNPAKRSGK
jgi:hypothetical protein